MASDADLQAMQAMVSASLQTVMRDLTKLQDKAKDSSSPSGGLGQLSTMFAGLTRQLAGPVGVAAAVYAVAQSLESFSRGRIQLQNFATDVGTGTRYVTAMQLAMEKAGISANESQSSIAKLGAAVKDLAARGTGSQLDQLLRDTRVSAEERKKLIEEARTDFDKAFQHTVEILNRGNKELQSFRAAQMGIAQSHLQAMQNTQQEMNKVYEADIEAARWWHKNWVNIGTGLSNTWESIRDSFNKNLRDLDKSSGGKVSELTDKFAKEGFSKDLAGKAGEEAAGGVKEFMKQRVEDPAGTYKKLLEFMPKAAGVANPLSLMTSPLAPFLMNFSKSSFGISSASAATPHQADTGVRQFLDLESDSNKSLRDIRDTLQRMETKDTKDQRGAGEKYGIGIRTPEGPMQGGLGGFRRYRGDSKAETPAGEGPAPTGLAPDQKSTAKIVAEEWRAAGMSEKGIAGIMANIRDESRFNPTLRHPDQPRFSGEAHFAHGLYQEGGTEWLNYKKWLDENYPNADWKDPRLQSRFAAQRLKSGYSGTWSRMNRAEDAGEAGAAYVDEYLKPAARYRQERMNRYRRGVPPVESYTGPMAPPSDAAKERETIDRSASFKERFDPSMTATIDFKNMPSWVRTAVENNGKFKELRVTRQTPQDGKAGVAWGDTNRWSYE